MVLNLIKFSKISGLHVQVHNELL